MPDNSAQSDDLPMLRRIHAAYSALPDGERRVADVILENPSDVAVFSASELATTAAVSNATVSRFFRRLGYENFDQARRDARRMRFSGSPLYTGDTRQRGTDPIPAFAAQEARLLESTLSGLDPAVLTQVATALAKAPRIRTLGYRNSQIIAEYVTAQFAQIRPEVAPLLFPGQTLSEGMAAMRPGDIAILIGFRRRPKDFTQIVRTLSARGIQVLLLADQSIREAPALSAWTLDCVVTTPQFSDSYVGAMSVIRLLTIETMRRLGEAGQAHLEMVEDLHTALGDLEGPGESGA